MIIPARSANLASYNQALTMLRMPVLGEFDTIRMKTDRIESAAVFYSGVFEKMEDRLNLPLVNGHYKLIKTTTTDFDPVLVLQNSDDLFGYARQNNALAYLFSAPFDPAYTNFSKHALFVPTMYRISFSSLSAAPLSYPVSANVVIPLKNAGDNTEQPPHIRQVESERDMIPELRTVNNGLFLHTRSQIDLPGFYRVEKAGQQLLPLAFNYSRVESDLSNYSRGELDRTIGERGWRRFHLMEDTQSDISAQVLQVAEGKKLWKLFILLALLFLAFEVAVLRFLK